MGLALAAALLQGGPGAAREAANALPAEAWQAKGPGTGNAVPAALATVVGRYRSPGEAFLALDIWARTHHPADDARIFSTGIAEVAENQGFDFRQDTNGDGEIDTHLYSHPLEQFGAFPRNCSLGHGATHRSGGVINALGALVYEPVEEPGGGQGPLIRALCESVYCQPLTRCGRAGEVRQFIRVGLPVYMARHVVNPGTCDAGWRLVPEDLGGRPTSSMRTCKHDGGLEREANLGGDCPALANGSNPVNTTTGNKFQREEDYAGTVHGELRFVRYYNSQQRFDRDLGLGWSHSFSAVLHLTTHGSGAQTARLYRPDGRVLMFNRSPGATAYVAGPLTVGVLRVVPGSTTALEFVDGEDRVERFGSPKVLNGSGAVATHYLLESRVDPRHGRREVLYYDARRRLQRVAGRFDRALVFEHDVLGRLVSMTEVGGRRHRYGYDRLNRLVEAIAPDDNDRADAPASLEDNPRRRYRYADADWPRGLSDLVDEHGTVYAHWDYDATGRAVSSEHAGGADRVHLDYQQAYTAVTDARGQTRSYNTRIEQGIGLITAASGGNCNFCGAGPLASTTYDDFGHRNLVTDHLGNVTDFDHDARGLELRRTEGQGETRRVIITEWHTAYRLPLRETVSDGTGRALRRVDYAYRGARLAERSVVDLATGGGTRSTRYTWYGDDDPQDPRAGLLAAVDGPRDDASDVTRYDYDAGTGNLTAITDALGHVTRYTAHDAEGRAVAMIDPNGVETRFEYDARGRLVARSAAGVRSSLHYDARGLLIAERQGDGAGLDYHYDDAQRLVRITDVLGNHIAYTLDAQGNRIGETVHDPVGTLVRRLERDYDARNQLTALIGGEGQVTRYGLDANGEVESVSDPRESVPARLFTRDDRRRVTSDTDGAGGVTRHGYDALDALTTITDPRGLVTRYTRNVFGEALKTDSPDAGVSEDEYDGAGNRVRHVYRQSAAQTLAIDYRYDALNRVTHIDYPGDTDIRFDYDDPDPSRHAIGRPSRMVDGSGTTEFDYDPRGNLRARRLLHGNTRYDLGYAYDTADRLQVIDYPSGLHLTLERDAVGRIAGLRAAIGATSVEIARDVAWRPFGGLARLRFGNGLHETREYDRAGRLSAILNSSATLPSYRYPRHDAADNPLAVEEQRVSGGTVGLSTRSYRYDALSRLVYEDDSAANTAYAYTYDANGNRQARAEMRFDGSLTRRVLYRVGTASNRLYGATPRNDDYDLAGNLLRHHTGYDVTANGVPSNIGPDLGVSYRYDQAGRLTTVLQQSRVLWTARYNGHGQRAVKYTRGDLAQPTVYLYAESGELLAAVSSAGGRPTTWREYLWLEGRPLAEVLTSTDGSAPRIRYLHVNQVNQLQYMTDYAGRMTLWSTGGDAFGFGGRNDLDVDRDGSAESPAILGGFPGQVKDGPVFGNGFRDYVAGLGRYLESDPIGLDGGINLYAYAINNPVRNIDRYGLAGGPGGGNHVPGKPGSCGSGANEPFVPDEPSGFSFSGCCERHDLCYGTCGMSKSQCDGEFKSCVSKACQKTRSHIAYEICIRVAYDYGTAVERMGQYAYDNAQTEACRSPPCDGEEK